MTTRAATRSADGISKTGGEQASNLQKIFTDNTRTVEIRMQSKP